MLLDLINGDAEINQVGKVLNTHFDYAQCTNSFNEYKRATPSEKKSITNFLDKTTFYHETESLICCHAVLNNSREQLLNKSKDHLLWNYNYKPFWKGKIFVHGHLPIKYPSITYNGININTYCGYGGYLTGLFFHQKTELLTFYSISENGILIAKSNIQYTTQKK